MFFSQKSIRAKNRSKKKITNWEKMKLSKGFICEYLFEKTILKHFYGVWKVLILWFWSLMKDFNHEQNEPLSFNYDVNTFNSHGTILSLTAK